MFGSTLQREVMRMAMAIALLVSVAAGSVLAQEAETLDVSDAAETRTLLTQAESLLAANNSQRAYAMLVAHEASLAGSPYYDYLLGVAALDSGRTGDAVFSLRRSITIAPEFSGARMELARAYFESGNSQLARPLFVRLLDENPPAGVRQILQQYIDVIDGAVATPQSRLSGFVETFLGYDTNANGSTSNQQFLGFTLTPDSQAVESPFAELAGGFRWVVPTSNRFNWFINGRAGYRSNFDASFVNATILNGIAGMSWHRGDWFGRAGLDARWSSRDGDSNESYAGLDLLLGKQLTETWDLSLGLRGGAQRYQDSIKVLDVDRYLYTLAAAHRFPSLATITFEVIGGTDNEVQPGSPYGNSKLGGRIGFSTPTGDASYLHASIGSLNTEYDGLFFGVPRDDQQFSAMLQLEFRDLFTQGLSLMPLLRYIDNQSDVPLYEYDRTEFGLIFRWTPN